MSNSSKFMFVYRSAQDASAAPPSPEEMQQIMTAWHQWFEAIGDSLVDGGDWLLPVGKQVQADGTISDGPFIEGKEMVGGYTIVKAESIDAAVALSRGCPVFHAGGWVEVRLLAGTDEIQPS
ncbi:MAG: YciI family protein [Planctomycetota bacterium]